MKAGVDAGLVSGLAGRGNGQGVVQEFEAAAAGLLLIALYQGFRELQQGLQPAALGHDKIPQMGAQRAHEMQCIEALGKNIVKAQQRGLVVAGQKVIYQMEAMVVVQNIKVLEDIGIIDLRSAECHRLVKDCQRIAHGTIGLQGNHMKGLVVDGDVFLGSDVP